MNRLLKLTALVCCVITVAGVCTDSEYLESSRYWLKCSRSSIDEVKSKLRLNLAVLTVSLSDIPEIPGSTFAQNASTIEELNLHANGISRIVDNAFVGLVSLKRLSLSSNELTKLKANWFYDLTSLEQLDVSFNRISELDPMIYLHLSRLKTFHVNDNALKEIPLLNIQNMNRLKDMRFHENPLTYLNRAQLTLLLNDLKVNWAADDDNNRWLDGVLWQCLTALPKESSNRDASMNVCVMSSMFKQLSTLLFESPTVASTTGECVPFKRSLTECLKRENVKTNGEVLTNLLALTNDAAGILLY